MEELNSIFKFYPEVKLVYFFGSKAKGNGGPLSDYDFAAYLDEKDYKKRFQIRLDILREVSRALGADEVDLSIINDIQSPEFSYNIIKEGKLIYEKEPYKVLIEPEIFHYYFDFVYGLRKYGITKT